MHILATKNKGLSQNAVLHAGYSNAKYAISEKSSDTELARLATESEEARNLLILRNLHVIKQAAIYVVIERELKELPEEFESIAVIKLLASEIWEKEILNIQNYIFRISKNAIIDEVRKETNQRRFVKQYDETSSLDKPKTLEEYVTDSPANDVNRNNSMLELEEELRRSIPLTYKKGDNESLVQQIVELSYGIDLGTNPSYEKLKGQEIANRFGINLGTMKTIKFMFNQVIRERFLEKAA